MRRIALAHLLGDHRREPLERLIEQEQRRIGYQCPRHGGDLLLAAREVSATGRGAASRAAERDRRRPLQIPSALGRRPSGSPL